MRLKLILTLTICACAIIAVGCARSAATTTGTAEGEEGQELIAGIPLAANFRITDIPIPAEFEFDRDNSFVFQNSMIDVGRIRYNGKQDITDVAQFYLDEMPRYNWTLVSVSELRTITLYFEKEDKSCQVLLMPKVRGTLVDISFFPKAAEQVPAY